jgi:hypothetical protein
LSYVHNRKNIKGVDTIKNLEFVDNKVNIIDTNNIIAHIIGIDFNSLYPSSYSSLPHPFNSYTDGIMYMPGPLKRVIKNEEVAMRIIKERKKIFSVDVKDHIDNHYLNEVVRFPSIFMNVDIVTNKETIGENMYEYKGYSIKGKLNFKDYFDVYTNRNIVLGTNNNMQLKKDIDEERLIMTNISVTKNVLAGTHTKYRVTKYFLRCIPLFLGLFD